SRSKRYMDPPGPGADDEGDSGGDSDGGNNGTDIEDQVFHDNGGIARLFTRFDWSHSDTDSLHMTLSANGTDFQIPNSFESQLAGQDQRQQLRDDFQALAWSHLFSGRTVGDFGVSRRSSTMHFVDPRVTGFPYYLSQGRRLRSEESHAKLTREWRLGTFLVGGEIFRLPIEEHFRLAATDPNLRAQGDPVGQFTVSAPFVFDDKRTGTRSSLYVQSHLRLMDERLTV